MTLEKQSQVRAEINAMRKTVDAMSGEIGRLGELLKPGLREREPVPPMAAINEKTAIALCELAEDMQCIRRLLCTNVDDIRSMCDRLEL